MGQLGIQKQSVLLKIVDCKESLIFKEYMKVWKEEIISMVSFNFNLCFQGVNFIVNVVVYLRKF